MHSDTQFVTVDGNRCPQGYFFLLVLFYSLISFFFYNFWLIWFNALKPNRIKVPALWVKGAEDDRWSSSASCSAWFPVAKGTFSPFQLFWLHSFLLVAWKEPGDKPDWSSPETIFTLPKMRGTSSEYSTWLQRNPYSLFPVLEKVK